MIRSCRCHNAATISCRSGHEIGGRTGRASAVPEVIGIRRQLLGAVVRDQEVVLHAQAAAAVPVDAGLDREDHAGLDRPAAGLVRVRRLVCTRADAVADRMAGLPRITGRVEDNFLITADGAEKLSSYPDDFR